VDLEFYNWTSQIRYPFVYTAASHTFNAGAVALSDDWVVDIGLLFDITSDFNPETDSAWLYRVTVTAANVLFYFESDAVGFVGPLIATVPLTADFGKVADFSLAGGMGSGYINIGYVDSLPAIGNYVADTNIIIEPSNIQTLKDSYVTSIVLCNDARLVATLPAGCEVSSSA
jgi:hypothetical protein